MLVHRLEVALSKDPEPAAADNLRLCRGARNASTAGIVTAAGRVRERVDGIDHNSEHRVKSRAKLLFRPAVNPKSRGKVSLL